MGLLTAFPAPFPHARPVALNSGLKASKVRNLPWTDRFLFFPQPDSVCFHPLSVFRK
jgi:hypothetical protein